MSFADLAAEYGDFYAPTFKVRVGEFQGGNFRERNTFTGADGLLSGVQVDTAIDRTNRFSFTLNDVFDRTSGTNGAFDDIVTSTFAEGTAIEVEMGYETDKTTNLVRATVDSVTPNFPANGVPSVSVSGHDLLHRLRKGTGSGRWTDTNLATVVEEVIEKEEVPFNGRNIEGKDVTITNLAHREESNYDFLQRRARKNGYEFFSRAGTFYFRTPKTRAKPELRLEYGRALRSFTPRSDSGRQHVGTVKVRHNDQLRKREIVGTAEVPGGGDKTLVETEPVRSTAEAEQRARAIARDIAERDSGQCETIGLPDLQIGHVLELGGLGSFSGRYYVESATHQLDQSGYTTRFNIQSATDE